MDDFILDTEKHCFLCSDPIPFKSSPNKLQTDWSATPATHSLQYLCRYLKMDMRKVFNEKGSIPPELLAKVEKAKLIVELCEECISLNKTFSKLYRKLEKIDMEVKSCVKLMHRKFVKTGNVNSAMGKLLCHPKKDGRAEIVDVLRNDGMEKCAAKLWGAPPRLRIQRLTKNQMDKKRRQLKIDACRTVGKMRRHIDYPSCSFENLAHPKAEPTSVKMESQTSVLTATSRRHSEDYCHNMDYSDEIETEEPEQSTNDTAQAQDSFLVERGAMETVSMPTNSSETDKYTVNPATGKYKCALCALEFKASSGWSYHYRSVHLNAKLKCNLCGKEFTQRPNFKRHYESAHMGVRFKCLGCNKEFSYKTTLTNHQKRSGCGVGLLQ